MTSHRQFDGIEINRKSVNDQHKATGPTGIDDVIALKVTESLNHLLTTNSWLTERKTDLEKFALAAMTSSGRWWWWRHDWKVKVDVAIDDVTARSRWLRPPLRKRGRGKISLLTFDLLRCVLALECPSHSAASLRFALIGRSESTLLRWANWNQPKRLVYIPPPLLLWWHFFFVFLYFISLHSFFILEKLLNAVVATSFNYTV